MHVSRSTSACGQAVGKSVMGQVSRVVAATAAVLGSSVLGACGGSVADADSNSGGVVDTRSADPLSPFCIAAKVNADAIRPLNALSTSGTRPESLSASVDEVRRSGAELVRVAPDDIRTDVERAVQAVNLQLDALVANDGDAAALARDPELMARLSSPELAGAGERYRAYVNRTCTASGTQRGTG